MTKPKKSWDYCAIKIFQQYLENTRCTINCEINLVLTWSENWVITDKATRNPGPDADPAVPAVDYPTNAAFKTEETKLYIPVVTSSTEDNSTLLE